jgi:integrase
MRGYTAKKGGRYYAVIYEGVDPATGKERRRWHPAGTTKKEADKVLSDLVKRFHDGRYRAPDKITFGAYLTDKWLPAQRARVRPSTFDSYERVVRMHVVDHIGEIAMQKLTAEDLDGLYAQLLGAGRRDGDGGLSVKTVRYVHGIIRKALADAARKGSVVRNVALDADPPKLSSARRPEMKCWTADELRRFLELVDSHRFAPAFQLAAMTGMRRGEVLGLRWHDVDLDSGRLSIRQAVISVAYKVMLADIKTDNGRRTIDLDDNTVAVLRGWRRRQREEWVQLAVRYGDDALVFAQPGGAPIHPDLFSQVFDRTVAHSGLPRLSLHGLRHTHATLLLRAGIPVKVVSERLGHATPAFTMTQYQHVLPGMQAEAARTFAALIR